MKLLVLFGVLVATLVSDARFIGDSSEKPPDLLAILCIAGQDLIDYVDQIGNIMAKDKYPENDVKFNKFFGCYWKNKGLIDEQGNLKEQNLKWDLENLFADGGKVTTMHKMLAQNIVNQCKNPKGENYGQKAVHVQNCILNYFAEADD